MYALNGQHGTNEKDGRPPLGKHGNDVSLADGPDGRANGSYQFDGTDECYIEFPNVTGTLDARPSITMLCWVNITNCSGPLFFYYSKSNSRRYFGMAISNFSLAAYFKGIKATIKSAERLGSNHWHYVGASHNHTSKKARLWVNGTVVNEGLVHDWTLGTGYDAVRIGTEVLKIKTFKFRGRIAALQVYNASLTKQQIEAVKCVSGQGKNIISKVSVG